MKTLLAVFVVLALPLMAYAGAETVYTCGTAQPTYFSFDVNNVKFYDGSSVYDQASHTAENATQIGGASSHVWATDDLPYAQYGAYVTVFLDSTGAICGIKSH